MRMGAGAAAVVWAALVLTGCSEDVVEAQKTNSPTATPTATPSPTPTQTPLRYVASDKPESLWLVVNKQRPLNPANYEPADMAIPTVITNVYGRPLRTIAARALDQLATAAGAEGIALTIASAYRSYDTQAELYYGYVARDGQAAADRYSAQPGYSEHQTGFAVDVDDGNGCLVDVCFADLPAGQWLAAHAWEYGFILRYPNGSEAITGYQFEPWHFRFVGVEVSRAMHNSGVATLEEFFGLPAAPGY